MSDAIAETAGGLLIDTERRVLLGLRASHKQVAPNQWDIIGGRVEAGESVEAALVRELQEELGVIATEFRLLASIQIPRPEHYEPTVHHVFVISAWAGGPPRNACDEHTEIRWFTAAEVRRLANKTEFDFDRLFTLAGLAD